MSAKEQIAKNIVEALPNGWRAGVTHGKLKVNLHVDPEVVDDLIAEVEQNGKSHTDRMKSALADAENLLEEILFQAKDMLVKPDKMPAQAADRVLPIARAKAVLKKIRGLRK